MHSTHKKSDKSSYDNMSKLLSFWDIHILIRIFIFFVLFVCMNFIIF
jgi:hypothetical protein